MPDNNLNEDLLNQLPQFKAGFDNLRDAVNNLNKEIVNSTDKFTKLNNQNKETVNWGTKIKNSVLDMVNTYKTLKDVITDAIKGIGAATEEFGGWAAVISAAFTLITTYGPQILNFFDNMFNSDKAREAAQSLKDYKEVMDTYITNISGERSELDMLVTIANNETLSKENRFEAIKKLNNLSPEYLNNLTLENLKTKEGKEAIEEYTKALNRKAMEEAIQAKRTEIAKQRYELKDEYDKDKDEVTAYRTGKKKDVKMGGSSYSINDSYVSGGSGQSFRLEAEKKFKEVAKKDKDLVARLSSLDEDLAKQLMTYAPKANNKTKDKSYWESFVQDQQTSLARLDASAKDYAAKAKPIADRIKQAQKVLALYNVSTDKPINKTRASKKSKPDPNAELQARQESADRMAVLLLNGYAKEVEETNQHFKQLKELHKGNNETLEKLEEERVATINVINQKFNKDGIDKLTQYENDLRDTGQKSREETKRLALEQLQTDYTDKNKIIDDEAKAALDRQAELNKQISLNSNKFSAEELAQLNRQITKEQELIDKAGKIKLQLNSKLETDKNKVNKDYDKETANSKAEELQNGANKAEQDGHNIKALQLQKQLLNAQKEAEIANVTETNTKVSDIETKFAQKKAQIENQLTEAKIHAGDQYIDAILKNTNKESAIYKAAFLAKKATAIADVIMSTKKSIIASFEGYSGMPFIGQVLAIAQGAFIATQGALSIATIAKQKPGFAQGGQFISDGRGAILPGYSHVDNTNAYLRSGEAVVVSEAMRNPWARNLVSAINVAHGGRDFSMPNPGRGYAIGGIFTDGGNANRYYSQPAHDVKDLANTLAYQMINNFPPIYVDVKDVNNQQNILAQTVNRVNL